ncbi:MAG: signal peptidase II [Holosporales bacterium]|nr:signal peptidase II [Holosporales bacterium]
MARLTRYLLLFSIATGILWADQQTKSWVQTLVQNRREVVVLTPYCSLVHVWNKGISFGFLDHVEALWLFCSFVGIAVLFFVVRTHKDCTASCIPLYGLIMGGALGNVVDRLKNGAVFDFLDFHWGDAHFPAFNLADACISMGAALLVLICRK